MKSSLLLPRAPRYSLSSTTERETRVSYDRERSELTDNNKPQPTKEKKCTSGPWRLHDQRAAASVHGTRRNETKGMQPQFPGPCMLWAVVSDTLTTPHPGSACTLLYTSHDLAQ
ncbi:unnamed protein product, partial [Ectocarpus sp. 13 AM-2016]